ncbi:amino acid transporter [Frankia sp. CNm7]|uniref:Amino acid transporter n=1 Tax=Frankia nepalensis TaxID=1836974 RepID=A0A937RN14_9ACTN|nr:amino acid transporter [Frankia nepalensis]MBL7497347.1 amino acid transporter [Frankia nepalensis]MBL7516243.1 amino acid transporter [Frankia nepalensis]MBL7516956.1 amino acid transporter [Frankia nepalensis]MBL7629423.1 amino acid transporter [Frankia nepalensis]
MTRAGQCRRALRVWLLQGLSEQSRRHAGPHAQPAEEHRRHSWWRVMCLTGVDYFSTLGYQPGIAVLAAGMVSPIATLVLVLVTLFGALPVYRRVARESPHGEGSIAMLERLLPWWSGKLLVLALLGFAATDFIITITLSAADATAHIVENPYTPGFLHGQSLIITLVLVGLLGAVFLRGFTEAVGIAVVLVVVYLSLNATILIVAFAQVASEPHVIEDWRQLLVNEHPNPFLLVGVALIIFPKLALGLSGFETGVAVMPLIKGDPTDTEERPLGRIRDARRLLTTAALIMSVFLLGSSLASVWLIPEDAFEPGGPANGRALAYLAHDLLGNGFGTVYDLSTILILWFAGASAMAGLLNLVPRYLPRYGMAPHWARAVRPLVLVFVSVGLLITWIFDASVDKQGAAYATGVLVLITSASLAVTLSGMRRDEEGRRHTRRMVIFGLITAIFVYTTVDNVIERPDGLIIASIFIFAIMLVSFVSRAVRAFELRVTEVRLDDTARRFIADAALLSRRAGYETGGHRGDLRLVANEPDTGDAAEYRDKEAQVRRDVHIPAGDPLLFVEVTISDASEFESALDVAGVDRHGYRVLRLTATSVPNAIAALLLHLRDLTGARPHVYFEWTEGNPFTNLLRFLVFGVGEVAPITREVLREAEPDRARRPAVHVG